MMNNKNNLLKIKDLIKDGKSERNNTKIAKKQKLYI